MTRSGRAALWIVRRAVAGLCMALAGIPAAQAAEVYRCLDQGRVVYQQRACPGPSGSEPMVLTDTVPDDTERAEAGRVARRQAQVAESLQRSRERFERQAATRGPAGFRHAAAEAARRGDNARTERRQAGRSGATTRRVTLRKARAALTRPGSAGGKPN